MKPWEQLAASQQALDDYHTIGRKLDRLPRWRWLARRRMEAERAACLKAADEMLLAFEHGV